MAEPNQQKRVFLDFLDQQGYMEDIHGMIGRRDKRLMLNLNHMRTFDTELTTNFMRRPGEYLPAFEEALREVITQQDPTIGKTGAMHEFRIGVEGNFGSHHVSPRELSAHLLNGLVCVEGIVTKCSLVRPKVVKSTHYCPKTNRYTTKECAGAPPPLTSSTSTASGAAAASFITVSTSISTIYSSQVPRQHLAQRAGDGLDDADQGRRRQPAADRVRPVRVHGPPDDLAAGDARASAARPAATLHRGAAAGGQRPRPCPRTAPLPPSRAIRRLRAHPKHPGAPPQ